MALIWADKVAETSTTTGTGVFTLAGALTGYQAFSAVCATSDVVYYMITAVSGGGLPSGEWESGLGTYSGANTLTRTTVLGSSNAGASVNFSAGTKRVTLSQVAATAPWGFVWTPLTFGSSATTYGQTVHTSNQTFTLSSPGRLEIEAYVTKAINTDSGVWVGDGTNGVNIRNQSDDNINLYRRSSSTDTSLVSVGNGVPGDYTGTYHTKLLVVRHAASTLKIRGEVDGRFIAPTADVTAFDLTTASISVQTSDIATCAFRARVIL